MTTEIPPLEWYPIADWHVGSCSVLKVGGLLRFIWRGRVVFIAYAASPRTGLGARIAAYCRGDVKSHRAAQLISRFRKRLELEIAFLDSPPLRIRQIAKELRRRESPPLNRKNAFAGRF